MEAEFVLRVQIFKAPSTNLPRNTSLRTSTGRKNRCCESIHREWSGARPPAGTTQWTCG